MASKHTFKVGEKVTFTGYTQLEKGQEEILSPGAEYKVSVVNGDGSLVVVDRDGKGDTVFDDEVTPVVKPKAKRAAKAAPATTPAKASKSGKAKGKTAPKKATTTKKTTTRKTKSTAVVEQPEAIIAAIQEITDSKSVQILLESKDMLTAAKELSVAVEETFISLGGVLSHIYDTGAHTHLGYTGKRSFADYMLNELNIQYRKGMYLIEIYKVARRYNLDERKIAEIGWSKMKEIASKIEAENASELLDYAHTHTREELVAHVRKTYVKAGTATDDPGRVLKTRMSFNFFGDQAEVVTRALASASAQIDNATPENALNLICAEWSQFTENVDLSVGQALTALVERFGAEAVAKALETENQKQVQEVVELIEA